MATDDEILKTLQRIERALSNSTITSSNGAPRRGAGTQRRDDTNQTGTSARVYRATAASLSSLNDSATNLNRTFTGLNRTVMNTRAGLIEMNRSLRSMRGATATPSVSSSTPAVDNDAVTRSVNDAMSSFFQRGNGNNSPISRVTGGRGGGQIGQALSGLVGRFGNVGVAVVSFLAQFKGAVTPLIKDILALHSAGIQASSALTGLYIDAARSGMSLAEYTKVLQESSPAVTRALSMADFNKTLQVSRDRLENLGIFGEEATKLSASLATSATTLGVPQTKLADATNAQIDTFQQLRKASLLTADQFQNLTHQLANTQDVQSQLLGMAPSERAARFAELTDMKTFGLSLGASKEASDAFGEALIKQRELTAPKRFEAAGRIRQSGAILGMDAGDSETLAQLSRKKNLSGEDKETALRLGSQLQARIEAAMNSGNIQQENIAEQLQSSLDSSGIGTLLKTAGNVSLQTQSGPAGVNKDFAKGTSDLLKATGRLNAWLEGLGKNPIANSISAALGSAAFSLGIGNAIGRLLGRFLPGGGRAAAGSGIAEAVEGAAGSGAGRVGGVVSRARAAVSGAFDLLRRMTDFGNMGPTLGEVGQTLGRAGTGLRDAVAGLGGNTQAAYQILRGSGFSRIGAIGEMLRGSIASLAQPISRTFASVQGLTSGAIETVITSLNRLTGPVQTAFQILRGSGFSTLGAIGEMIQGTIATIGKSVNPQAIASGATEIASTVRTSLGSILSTGVEGASAAVAKSGPLLKGLSTLVMGSVGSIIGGAFRFLGGSGVFSSIIGGVMELFTGDLGSALNADDGSTWFGDGLKGFTSKAVSKIGDVIGGMIHGFATGITDLGDGIIAAWNWTIGSFFSSLQINLDSSLTNLFDRSWTSIMIMFKELKLKVAKFFGMDTKDIEADIAVAKASRDKLEANGKETLTSIGDANQKLTAEQKAAADKTTANVNTATKNIGIATGVITSTQGLTARVLADSAQLRASNGTSSQIATPGQTVRQGITDPNVNKPTDKQQPDNTKAPQSQTDQPQQPSQMDTLIGQVTLMVGLLQQMLTAEQLQASGLEGLARGLGKPSFTDNEAAFKILNQS